MKRIRFIVILLLIANSSRSQRPSGVPEVNPTTLQKNFQNWFKYQTTNIMLSTNFDGVDIKGKPLSKDQFFQKLNSGLFIPIRLKPIDKLVYKLYKIAPKADSSIKATIMQLAFDEYEHFKMEGKPFPKFDFTDLNGNVISNETMKGKFIIIKCWYIHCTACIEEFPAVNQLAAKYKERTDMQFLSLAEDTPAQLTAFLAKKPLSYAVVPNMKTYMNQALHLNGFPTHFILDKEGKMLKIVSDYESLNTALETLLKD
jgi:peroxiredoxin